MTLFRRLNGGDFFALHSYLMGLSATSRSRFGPHGFELDDIKNTFYDTNIFKGYIAVNEANGNIIAYTIVKVGFLDHDAPRLLSFGFSPDNLTDCTLAPSVSDAWQGKHIGSQLFEFVKTDLRTNGIKRIILWGGVQVQNVAAVVFYRKHGFMELGRFEYHGENLDMVLEL
jgi:ribosomal protein S18 acetylase RimI-like enzyme